MRASIKAIETRYKGYRFRSRLEARWAVFFDSLGVKWEYEREGFDLGKSGYYLPDFFIPELGWVEIKPASLDDDEEDKLQAFGSKIEQRIYVFIGNIPNPETVDLYGSPWDGGWYDDGIVLFKDLGYDADGDSGYQWCSCVSGKHFGIEYEARGGRISCGCNPNPDDGKKYYSGAHPTIVAAYAAARSARFEHGENGQPISAFHHPVSRGNCT